MEQVVLHRQCLVMVVIPGVQQIAHIQRCLDDVARIIGEVDPAVFEENVIEVVVILEVPVLAGPVVDGRARERRQRVEALVVAVGHPPVRGRHDHRESVVEILQRFARLAEHAGDIHADTDLLRQADGLDELLDRRVLAHGLEQVVVGAFQAVQNARAARRLQHPQQFAVHTVHTAGHEVAELELLVHQRLDKLLAVGDRARRQVVHPVHECRMEPVLDLVQLGHEQVRALIPQLRTRRAEVAPSRAPAARGPAHHAVVAGAERLEVPSHTQVVLHRELLPVRHGQVVQRHQLAQAVADDVTVIAERQSGNVGVVRSAVQGFDQLQKGDLPLTGDAEVRFGLAQHQLRQIRDHPSAEHDPDLGVGVANQPHQHFHARQVGPHAPDAHDPRTTGADAVGDVLLAELPGDGEQQFHFVPGLREHRIQSRVSHREVEILDVIRRLSLNQHNPHQRMLPYFSPVLLPECRLNLKTKRSSGLAMILRRNPNS